ncbi:hypothetical protein ACVWWZ_000659 [Thermostichus sp. OS-CIW-39]
MKSFLSKESARENLHTTRPQVGLFCPLPYGGCQSQARDPTGQKLSIGLDGIGKNGAIPLRFSGCSRLNLTHLHFSTETPDAAPRGKSPVENGPPACGKPGENLWISGKSEFVQKFLCLCRAFLRATQLRSAKTAPWSHGGIPAAPTGAGIPALANPQCWQAHRHIHSAAPERG